MTAGFQQVHLRVNDSATGQPTPVRLRITDGGGTYHAPFGRLTAFATDSGRDVGDNVLLADGPWSFIDGTCEILVPPGPLRLQATKGPEYRPIDTQVELHSGRMSLRLTIERWQDLAPQGWYSGDPCCYFLTPHATLLEAAAEDLAVVDLLVRETFHEGGRAALANISAFSGQHPALERAGHRVVVNTRNDGAEGHLLLLNCHRIVYPLSSERGARWGLRDWCDQCHRKGGLVIADDWLVRGPTPEMVDPEFIRRLDAIRFLPDQAIEPWFAILDRGVRLPLVAGSGKESNREVLGSWRTYANVPVGTGFDYRGWIEAIRGGRTFVTCGPILRLNVNGVGPGEVVSHADARMPLRVEAEVASLSDIDALQLLHNGQVLEECKGPSATLRIHESRSLPHGGWIVARAICAGSTVAMTSPIYVPI